MGGGFYKVNNEVLKLDIKKHKDEILFNHYLMQKENLQRLKGGLPKGQFYLTVRQVAHDLDLKYEKCRRMIKHFEELEIIKLIKKGGKDRSPSLYTYTAISNEKNESVNESVSKSVNKSVENSVYNHLQVINDSIDNPVDESVNMSPKKELLKRNIKNNIYISKDIYVSTNVDIVIEKWNSLNLSKIISIKGNRLKMLNARIKEYEIGGVLAAIENVRKSKFLNGQNNRNWIINFDWFIRPNNFIKVLEGNYIDKGSVNNARNNSKNNETSQKPKYDFSCFE